MAASLLACVLAQAMGCATGGLVSLGRRTERAVALESAFTDGPHLWLAYRAEKRDRKERLVATYERAVVLQIDDLDPERGHLVDAFPLERMSPEAIPDATLRPVPLVDASREDFEGACLIVETQHGLEEGFLADHLDGAPEGARFYAEALTDRDVAPWIVPLLPFALAWDAVTVPILAVSGPVVWAWAD